MIWGVGGAGGRGGEGEREMLISGFLINLKFWQTI